MNDFQSSVRRNQSGVSSSAQLTQIINGQPQHRRAPLFASSKALLAGALVALLSACSGGGGGTTSAPILPQSVNNAVGSPVPSQSTTLASPSTAQQRGSIELLKEFRPIGGLGNSVPGSPELAIAPLNFAPGTKDGLVPGPNPRTISNVIAGGTGAQGQSGQTTDPVLSAWLYVFGQFVDHDLDLEATPTNSAAINIAVPAGDPYFAAGTVIAMTRATRNPGTNTIINTTAGYLDLSQLYGSDTTTAASLANADGTLKTSGNGLYLPVVNDQFVSGDPRVMENPELTVATTLFMREHNFWVRTLKAQHPNWTGLQLYKMAKAITTAEYQNIVYKEYLPHLIGPVLGSYTGYSGVNAQVTQEFSTAAFRVGHSQISDTQEGLNDTGSVVFTESLAQSFFNTPEIDEANGIDPLLRALGADNAQATDPYVVAALRDLLFAGLVGGGVDQMDLIAIDIQRERDAGLGTLNQTRRALGLMPYSSFDQFISDPTTKQLYKTTYNNDVDSVDLFMGGLAEPHVLGGVVGATFNAIIADQFKRLRAGDRFWWQNEGFEPQAASMIASTTLTTLMRRNTDTRNLQADLFIQATYPVPHVKRHVPHPSFVNGHGRKPFLDDGV